MVPGGGIESSRSKGGLKIPSMLGNFNADTRLHFLDSKLLEEGLGSIAGDLGRFRQMFY
jgi:hypothetical protein